MKKQFEHLHIQFLEIGSNNYDKTMFMYIIIYKDMKFLINNSILLRRFNVDVLKWKLLNNTRVMMEELNTNHNNHNDNISCCMV